MMTKKYLTVLNSGRMSLQFNAINAFLCMECMYFNFEVRPIAELLIYMYVLQMTRIQTGKK